MPSILRSPSSTRRRWRPWTAAFPRRLAPWASRSFRRIPGSAFVFAAALFAHARAEEAPDDRDRELAAEASEEGDGVEPDRLFQVTRGADQPGSGKRDEVDRGAHEQADDRRGECPDVELGTCRF